LAADAQAAGVVPRQRDRDDRRPQQLLPFRALLRRDGQLELFVAARNCLRLAR
jgi:hypothetical protein